MPALNVLRLEEYRDRRSARLRLAHALHRADPRRYSVFNHLVEVSELAGADRAAAVWVDEHGTGLIHPYVVVDHLSSHPRRMFVPEPLRGAWQLGVPSAYDSPAVAATATPATFAISLGSDGTRAWFVVADSVMPRPAVDGKTRDRLMFLAGECAAVVLHRDLDASRDSDIDGVGGSRFAGWDVLADLEGRESDELESRRIAQRFVVARLVHMLVDDDLTVSRERAVEQVRRARAELADAPAEGEGEILRRTLSALEDERLDDLATALVDLGDAAEAQDHTSGALDIYRCAYDISAAIGSARPAAEAARLSGRLARRRADWSGARTYFERAHEVAEVAGLHDVAAQVMVGLAGISKETGNLPAARKGFQEALTLAELSGHRDTIALVHHGWLGLEQAAGNLETGLRHGWVGVAMYENDVAGRMRCLASLAGALVEYGDYEAAEDAWSVVASSCDEKYYRVFAHDALAHLAALRSDRQTFQSHVDACESLGWQSGTGSAKAQLLYYRGLSYRALGELDLAEEWLSAAVTFAEEHQYNQMMFRAEEALRSVRAAAPPSSESDLPPAAPREVRDGLRAMRRELVGTEA